MNYCQSEQIVTLLRQLSAQLENIQNTLEKAESLKDFDALENAIMRLSFSIEAKD